MLQTTAVQDQECCKLVTGPWYTIFFDITPVFGIISNCFTNLQNRVISLKKMLIVFCGQKWYIIYYDLFSLDLEDNAEEQKLFNKSENKKKMEWIS